MIGLVGMFANAGIAYANHTILTLDGTEYTSYKHSGSADHYLTPAAGVTTSSVAFTAKHTWNGVNGADVLEECQGEGDQLHWIDNKNVLTISHCVFGEDPSETPSPTPSETPSPTPSETETPSPSESESPTASETKTPTPSESSSASVLSGSGTVTPSPLADTGFSATGAGGLGAALLALGVAASWIARRKVGVE